MQHAQTTLQTRLLGIDAVSILVRYVLCIGWK